MFTFCFFVFNDADTTVHNTNVVNRCNKTNSYIRENTMLTSRDKTEENEIADKPTISPEPTTVFTNDQDIQTPNSREDISNDSSIYPSECPNVVGPQEIGLVCEDSYYIPKQDRDGFNKRPNLGFNAHKAGVYALEQSCRGLFFETITQNPPYAIKNTETCQPLSFSSQNTIPARTIISSPKSFRSPSDKEHFNMSNSKASVEGDCSSISNVYIQDECGVQPQTYKSKNPKVSCLVTKRKRKTERHFYKNQETIGDSKREKKLRLQEPCSTEQSINITQQTTTMRSRKSSFSTEKAVSLKESQLEHTHAIKNDSCIFKACDKVNNKNLFSEDSHLSKNTLKKTELIEKVEECSFQNNTNDRAPVNIESNNKLIFHPEEVVGNTIVSHVIRSFFLVKYDTINSNAFRSTTTLDLLHKKGNIYKGNISRDIEVNKTNNAYSFNIQIKEIPMFLRAEKNIVNEIYFETTETYFTCHSSFNINLNMNVKIPIDSEVKLDQILPKLVINSDPGFLDSFRYIKKIYLWKYKLPLNDSEELSCDNDNVDIQQNTNKKKPKYNKMKEATIQRLLGKKSPKINYNFLTEDSITPALREIIIKLNNLRQHLDQMAWITNFIDNVNAIMKSISIFHHDFLKNG
ncbi:hypothetical protein CDIK_2284 [Cucumispora dikerogammari]|nr:hypothetical protein CDIK_2284 [Cucumispora dikerogammari]